MWLFIAVMAAIVGVGITVVRLKSSERPEPSWKRLKQEQDMRRWWRHQSMLVRFLLRSASLVPLAAMIWWAALYNHYMLYAPRSSNPKTGHIYPEHFKSIVAYLTTDELASYRLAERVAFATFVTAVIMAICWNLWISEGPGD